MTAEKLVVIMLFLPVGTVILLYLFRHPEIAFALFIFAYVMEGGQCLLYIPLSAIMLVIAGAGFLLPVALGCGAHFRLDASDLCLWCFIIILFAGSYLVPSPQYGLEKATRFFTAVFAPYMLARIFMRRYDQLQYFLSGILVTASLVGFTLIITSAVTGDIGRLYFFEANPIPVAVLLSIGLIIAVIGTLGDLWGNSRLGRAYSAAIIPMLLYSLLLTASRGPLIAMVLGLASYFAVRAKSIWRLNLRIALAGGVVLVAWALRSRIWRFLLHRVPIPNIYYYNPTFILEGLPTLERLEKYSAAIALFKQSPLLGVGTSGFGQLTDLGYPHNIFLEIAVENGLFGLMVFGFFLMVVAHRGSRYLMFYLPRLDKQMQSIGLAVIMITVSLLVEKQFSFALDMNKDLFTFLGLMVNLPTMAPGSGYSRSASGE